MPKWSRNQMFFTFSTLFMLLVALYICFRLILPLELTLWLKIPILVAVVLASQTMSLMRYIVVKAPQLPFWLMRAGGFICAVFMVLISVVALRDLLLLALWLLHSVLGTWFPNLAKFIAFLNSPLMAESLLLLSIIISALGMWRALQVPRVRTVELKHPDLPEFWNQTRIVQLSDLHIGSTFNGVWLRKVVARTNSLKPDFVLITGDLVDGEPCHMSNDMRALTDLQANLAVLISVGNHEYYSGLLPWVESWRAMGLTVLLNEHRVFSATAPKSSEAAGIPMFPAASSAVSSPSSPTASPSSIPSSSPTASPPSSPSSSPTASSPSSPSSSPSSIPSSIPSSSPSSFSTASSTALPTSNPLIIAGIADPTASHFPGMLLPDPVAALANAPEGFRILMAHQPKHAAKHASLGFHIQLSGHTHGGQYVPLFPIVSLLNRGFRTGLYHVRSMLLYVSPGTGLWGYVPMRIGASSEITELILSKCDSAPAKNFPFTPEVPSHPAC